VCNRFPVLVGLCPNLRNLLFGSLLTPPPSPIRVLLSFNFLELVRPNNPLDVFMFFQSFFFPGAPLSPEDQAFICFFPYSYTFWAFSYPLSVLPYACHLFLFWRLYQFPHPPLTPPLGFFPLPHPFSHGRIISFEVRVWRLS